MKSQDEADRIAESLLQKVKFLRDEASQKSERFDALTKEQLVSKIKGETSNSPFFFAQSWSGGVPGGSTTYTAYVENPDPTGYSGYSLFGYLLFGPANFIADVTHALTSVDRRFPNYYMPCGVAAGADTSMTFNIDMPSRLSLGTYIGNCFLVLQNSWDIGRVFDQASFDLQVS